MKRFVLACGALFTILFIPATAIASTFPAPLEGNYTIPDAELMNTAH